ncbi:MAG: hypothetical protein NDI94_05525 [Candidatus Woesearchaeota archaeon]|nr:hypothetical protein [Candidatus Woesearchaeota archaeon]
MKIGALLNPRDIGDSHGMLETEIIQRIEPTIRAWHEQGDGHQFQPEMYPLLVIGKNWYSSFRYGISAQENGVRIDFESFGTAVLPTLDPGGIVDPRKLIYHSELRHGGFVTLIPWSTATEKSLRFYSSIYQYAFLPAYGRYNQVVDNFDVLLFPNQNIAKVDVLEKMPNMTLQDNLILSLPLMNPPIAKVAGMDAASYITLSYETLMDNANRTALATKDQDNFDLELRCYNMYGTVISRHVAKAFFDGTQRKRIGKDSADINLTEYPWELSEDYDIKVYLHNKAK